MSTFESTNRCEAILMTITSRPPTTKIFNKILGSAVNTLPEFSDPRLISDIPFFSIICERKFVSTVNRIRGMYFDIVRFQVLGVRLVTKNRR